jgi:hypothetical protein
MDYDHLLPEDSPFCSWHQSGHDDYLLAVARTLLKEGEGQTVASVVCLPPFDPEWALLVQQSAASQFSAILTEAGSMIWRNPDRHNVRVQTQQYTFDPSIGSEVCAVWHTMLRGVKYPHSVSLVLDGSSYHFTFDQKQGDSLAGYTCSPQRDTAPGKLTALSEMIRRMVRADESQRGGITREIADCLSWFKAMSEQAPVRERAESELLKVIRKRVQYYQEGITSEAELVSELIDIFHRVRYPQLARLLEIVAEIPPDVQLAIRQQPAAGEQRER